jgi:hypothetical protein
MKTVSLQPKYLKWALLIGTSLVMVLGMFSFLKPQPERYTELYFDKPQQLPSVWPAKPVAFAFRVHNQEGHTVTYNYQVFETTAAGVQLPVATGQLALPSGAAQDVPVKLTVPVAKTRTEVTVVLPDQQQQIHFWIGA